MGNHFKTIRWDEKEKYNIVDEYELLLGPDGFECRLTEPEDRTFYRDLSILVEKLNELYEENQKLKNKNNGMRIN